MSTFLSVYMFYIIIISMCTELFLELPITAASDRNRRCEGCSIDETIEPQSQF